MKSGSRACLATGACANLAITLISHGIMGLMKLDASVLTIAIKLIAACACWISARGVFDQKDESPACGAFHLVHLSAC